MSLTHGKYVRAAFVLILGLFFIFPARSWAGRIREFSADQVVLKNGKVQVRQKIYKTEGKMRVEMSGPRKGDRSIMIFRRDKMLSWTLLPREKAYLETRLDKAEADARFRGYNDADVKTKDLGTEVVNGYKCRKKRIQTTMKVMGRKVVSNTVVWISDRIDLPVRTQGEDGTVTELRNIKEGRPAKALFEVPSGYKKMDDFRGVFSPGRARTRSEARPHEAEQEQAVEQGQEEEGSLFDIPKVFKKFKLPFGGGDEK